MRCTSYIGRINRAVDDAAGLSVSSLLDVDRRVSQQGIRNINDGISYLNIADGALSELTQVVSRISELAEQSANGTLGASQREALQEEVTSLQAEHNRIVETTRFNENQLLTGLTTKTVLQGGYGDTAQLITQIGDSSLGIESDPTRAGLVSRVDIDSSGTAGNAASEATALSADGRYVVFNSDATNLVAGDTNAVSDVFVKDTSTGETIRVSTDSTGNEANGTSYGAAISADGRFVAFESTATNLVSGDTNGARDVFIKDLITGVTTRVSTDKNGNEASGGSTNSYVKAISADGRFVAFQSYATSLVPDDTNGERDAFVKDTRTGEIVRVNTDSDGNQAIGGTSVVRAISADGRYVTFESDATNLVTGDTNGMRDAFVKDILTGKTTRVNTDSNGNEADDDSYARTISADGRFAAFDSVAENLVPNDTGRRDAFIKNLQSGETIRVSTDINGNQADGNSYMRAISADGRFVVFESTATNLVSDDTNGLRDVFLYDALTGKTRRVSTDNNGDQRSSHSYASAISADGRFVAMFDENGESFVRDLSRTGLDELSGMVVSNQASARVTLDLSKKYQKQLSGYQAGLGATLSRAATFVSTLQVQTQNFETAASRITDADVAEESAQLLKSQTLQQSATAILAQANQQPELALRLLQTA